MQLLELTPAEIAFLTPPHAAPGCLQTRLTRKLAAMLSARLRLAVQTLAQPVDAPDDAPATPGWRADPVLATLWLTRRLGGQHLMGQTAFVPPSLIQALDAALAECWLDGAMGAAPPPAMAWHITAASARATLAVQLPHHPLDMTRWAREVIRHG
jgi:hypothetical protein